MKSLNLLLLICLFIVASCEGVGTAEFNDQPTAAVDNTDGTGSSTTTGTTGGGGDSSFDFDGISSIDGVTDRSVTLNWVEHADAIAYEVYRVSGATVFFLAYLAAPVDSYEITGLTADTEYSYRVVARDSSGESSPSATPTTVTTNAAPAIPSDIDLNSPAVSPAADATPTVRVSGVNSGDTIKVYDDTCATELGSAVAGGVTVDVTLNALVNGTYRLRATASATNESACSTQYVDYEKIDSTLLLDVNPGAKVAYGLRKLGSGAINAIKVRRSSDDTTLDIGFDGDHLDTTALLTFVGAGHGYIDTWYDQSGNGNHATQASTANQPMIVNTGALFLDSSLRPNAYFNASSAMTITTPFNAATMSAWIRTKMLDNGNNRGPWLGTAGGNAILLNDQDRYFFYTSATGVVNGAPAPQSFKTIRYLYTGANVTAHEDGVERLNTAIAAAVNDIGVIGLYSGRYFYGLIGEMVIYDSDKTSIVADIDTNYSDYFTPSGYAVFNPAYSSYFTLTNNYLTATLTGGSGSWQMFPANIGKTSGKWYFEVTYNAGANLQVGVATSSAGDYYLGNDAFGFGYTNTGVVYNNGGTPASFAAFVPGEVLGVAMDLDTDSLTFYVDGVLQGSVSIAGIDGSVIYPMIAQHPGAGVNCTANFGASAFQYPVPIGYNSGVYE